MELSVRLALGTIVVAALSRIAYGQVNRVEGSLTTSRGSQPPTSWFSSTMWLNRPLTECKAEVSDLVSSENNEYVMEQALVCLNETIKCWVGVRNRPLSGRAASDPISTRGMLWELPVANLTITESCTLRFTNDGNLQFVASDLDVENGMPYHPTGEVLWESNTTGKGGVQLQLQDNGNLVMVHSDGKQVVWKSMDAPLLPLSPVNAATSSMRINMWSLFMLLSASASLLNFNFHQLS